VVIVESKISVFSLGVSHGDFILLASILMLLEEGVVHKFLDIRPLVRIFLETAIQEVPHLRRHTQVRWNLDLIFHYLYQLLLPRDLEGILANHHLVHHDTDRPNIDLLIVFSPLQDFGANVEGSAAESSPQFIVLVHRPSEIAQLDDVLHGGGGTS